MSRRYQPLVLVVEDEPLVRMVAADGLNDEGFDVLEAGSAQEALDILNARSDVGVLFTDVNMPGSVDGVQLARLVHERWPNLRVVVTSGREPGDLRSLLRDAAFVPKPYLPYEIAQVIHRLVR